MVSKEIRIQALTASALKATLTTTEQIVFPKVDVKAYPINKFYDFCSKNYQKHKCYPRQFVLIIMPH